MRALMPRSLWFAVLAVAAALTLAACGGSSSSTGSTSGGGTSSSSSASGGGTSTGGSGGAKGGTIGFSIPQGTDPGLQLLDKGMQTEAQKLGMTVKTTDANLDVNKQLADLDAFIQQKVSTIVVWPLDSHAVEPAIQRAAKANIPVIAIYALTGGPYYTDLIIDGKGVGRSAADYLARTLGKGAKVGAIFGPPQVDQFREMAEGFKAGAAAAGLDVLNTQVDAQISSQTTASLVQDFKQRFGSEMKGIFTCTDTQARGAFSTEGGGFAPKIVTYANLDDTLNLIRTGKYGAGVYQNGPLIGRMAAWASAQALDGKKIPSKLYLELPVLDQQSAKSFPDSQEQMTKPYSFKPVQKNGKYYMPVFQ